MALTAYTNWYVRAGGSQTNGGGYDSTISGAGTNYADQDAAQVVFSAGNSNRLSTSGAGATTITSAGTPFTSAMVGNCIRISAGTNFQTGYYFITSYTSTSQVVLDRTPTSGGAGSNGDGSLGGAHASLINYANGGSGLGTPTLTTPLAAGHTVNIRGGGTDDPAIASLDYDFSAGYWTFPAGNLTTGPIKFVGYNGRPGIKYCGLLSYTTTCHFWQNIKAAITTSTYTNQSFINGSQITLYNCIIDANNVDARLIGAGGFQHTVIDCEFRCTGSSGAGTVAALDISDDYGGRIIGCYIHNLKGPQVKLGPDRMNVCANNIIASGLSDGILMGSYSGTSYNGVVCFNNTIDSNAGHGINIPSIANLVGTNITNNIIANQTGGSKYGITITTGTTASNDNAKAGVINYNALYNNTGSYNAISAGANDVALSAAPYTGSGNYALNSTAGGGAACKQVGFPTAFRGSSTSNYPDFGAAQAIVAAVAFIAHGAYTVYQAVKRLAYF
jgi:hypothetical protein